MTTTSPPRGAIIAALRAASQSPCVKSKRGVSIYDTETGLVLCDGFNSQPSGVCDLKCMANCNKLCMHAEQRAIMAAQPWMQSIPSCDGVHVKIMTIGGAYTDKNYADDILENLLVPSGGPSCWQCSRLVLDSKLKGFWLFHDAGWRRYDAEEFHRLTLEACGLS